MNKFYSEFIKYLDAEDKGSALNCIITRLNNNEIDIVTLYTEILSPSFNNLPAKSNDSALIWKEHIRSSIIRTIIENCYPYVIQESKLKYKLHTNKNVAVVCPPEEYHEIGPRIIADFFTLLGYNTIFVGSNTPVKEFINALKLINLDYLALSVTNYYNLVALGKTIESIRRSDSKVKIIVGGSAFKHNAELYKRLGADLYLHTFEDIVNLAKEDKI